MSFTEEEYADMVYGAETALLWTECDDDDIQLCESFGPEDIAESSRREFGEAVRGLADSMPEDTRVMMAHYAATSRGQSWSPASLWGHDFTLTMNRHGAGFWDRGETSGAAERLTAMCVSTYGAYVGDDGLIYIS